MESNKNKDIFEISEISEIENDINDKKLVEKSNDNKLSSGENLNFTYDVQRVGNDLVITFNQWSQIKHHTSRGYYPNIDYHRRSGDQSIVKRNQWLQAKINGNWSLLGDADNR